MLGVIWLIFAMDPKLKLAVETFIFQSDPKIFTFCGTVLTEVLILVPNQYCAWKSLCWYLASLEITPLNLCSIVSIPPSKSQEVDIAWQFFLLKWSLLIAHLAQLTADTNNKSYFYRCRLLQPSCPNSLKIKCLDGKNCHFDTLLMITTVWWVNSNQNCKTHQQDLSWQGFC